MSEEPPNNNKSNLDVLVMTICIALAITVSIGVYSMLEMVKSYQILRGCLQNNAQICQQVNQQEVK